MTSPLVHNGKVYIASVDENLKGEGHVYALAGEDGEISGTLEIQYFVGGYGDAWWKWVIEDFKKAYPNVEIVEYAGSDVNETMKPNWISGNPPDVSISTARA